MEEMEEERTGTERDRVHWEDGGRTRQMEVTVHLD